MLAAQGRQACDWNHPVSVRERASSPKLILDPGTCHAFVKHPTTEAPPKLVRFDAPPGKVDAESTNLHLLCGPCDGAPRASASPQPPRDASRGKRSTATGCRGPHPAPGVSTKQIQESTSDDKYRNRGFGFTGSRTLQAISRRLISRSSAMPPLVPRSCAPTLREEGSLQTGRFKLVGDCAKLV